MRGLGLALACALAVGGCQPRSGPATAPVTASRLHVLAINGGGKPAQNYQSHLLHVRRLLDLLARAGVPATRIALFSGDGEDPAPDLAVREVQPEADFWLVAGTRLETLLRTPVTLVTSEVPGFSLKPATKAALGAWFDAARRRLRPGDTLLLYVTDHGTKNAADTTNNRITLWNEDGLSVRELRELLATLDPGVRVVALMSQCFSGSFAHLVDAHRRDGQPLGNVCGYYASTAERPAYGCYPENRGKDNVGHSFDFFQALAAEPSFPAAHAATLVADGTPDVPIRSSDVYLEGRLRAAAAAEGVDFAALVDRLLAEAWRDRAAWEPEIRLLDRIGHRFGLFSPRSLGELDEQAERLPKASETLDAYAKAWKAALGDLLQTNLERFLRAHPAWAARLDGQPVASLDPATARDLTSALLADLAPYTRAARPTARRLAVLRDKASAAAAATYRMEVRLGVVLRMRTVLTSVAGRHYLATRGAPEERAAHEALRACEDLRLAEGPLETAAAPPAREPFPPYEEDVRLAQAVLPGWMGIRFKQPSETLRASLGVGEGAAAVVAVYPDSPAAAAGFQLGDVVVGPPGSPFTERNQIREWTMLSAIDRAAPLEVRRGRDRLQLTLVPKPFPLKWPELPGPPKLSSPAPRLRLAAYRGTPPPPGRGKAQLLFFWATWCLPCKAALPELLAYERSAGTPVVAITDEPAEHLDGFFRRLTDPFPATVAIDEFRHAFLAYGVSGTPTFVLIDGEGLVRSYATGYAPERGLGIAGWSWAGRNAGR